MYESLLVLDFSNTVIRSLAVHQQLEFNGTATGGLFGVINQLANQIKRYQPTHIIACKDSPPYLRKKYYPDYKKKDKPQDPEWKVRITDSFKLVDELFKQLAIPTWAITGLEADDLIARIVQKKNNDYKKIYVLSNDDDLNQLLHIKNLCLLRKNKEYDYDCFKRDFPTLEPADWIMTTTLCGTHNAVKGLDRVGLKTAIKLMDNPDKLKTVYEQNKELLERNYMLIELPFPKVRWTTHTIPELNTLQINEMNLIRYVEQYGIRYSTSMMEAFYHYSTRNRFHV